MSETFGSHAFDQRDGDSETGGLFLKFSEGVGARSDDVKLVYEASNALADEFRDYGVKMKEKNGRICFRDKQGNAIATIGATKEGGFRCWRDNDVRTGSAQEALDLTAEALYDLRMKADSAAEEKEIQAKEYAEREAMEEAADDLMADFLDSFDEGSLVNTSKYLDWSVRDDGFVLHSNFFKVDILKIRVNSEQTFDVYDGGGALLKTGLSGAKARGVVEKVSSDSEREVKNDKDFDARSEKHS